MVQPESSQGRRRRRLMVRFGPLMALALVLSSCSLVTIDSPLTTWEPAGPIADRIDGLFWPVFYVAAVVFVLVQGALIYTVIAFRDRPDRPEPKQVHGNAVLEVTWTVIPSLILAVLAVPTVQAVFDLTECSPDALTIEVIGHQWWFEYHYPDTGITTANVIVMPVDQEVCAVMTSDDVLHNFWIPALNGKRYLVPGQETILPLEADETGEFWGHCAEFCGLSHSLMRARGLVLTQAEYDQWVEDQQQPAIPPEEGTQEFTGLEVFANNGCAACHNVDYTDEDREALSDAGIIIEALDEDAFNGPDLTHFASRNVFAGAYLPYEGLSYEDALAQWIENPPLIKPGSFMPDLGLTAQEIDDVIAWLASNE